MRGRLGDKRAFVTGAGQGTERTAAFAARRPLSKRGDLGSADGSIAPVARDLCEAGEFETVSTGCLAREETAFASGTPIVADGGKTP